MNNSGAFIKKNVHVSTVNKYLIYIVIVLTALTINDSVLVAQHGNISAKDKKSIDAMTEAHKSLGGSTIDNIDSLILTGSQISGVFETRASTSKMTRIMETVCEFEIRVQFPDDFIHIRRCPDLMNGLVIYYGISNGSMFSDSATLQNEVLSRSTPDSSVALDEWNRLLVGMIMKNISTPLMLSTDSSDNFVIKNEDRLLGTIVFDVKDKWPAKINYNVTALVPVLSKGSDGRMVYAGDSRSEERSAYVQFSDRFSVDGIMFPKTITRVNSGEVEVAMTINDVKINPKLSKEDFGIPAKFAK